MAYRRPKIAVIGGGAIGGVLVQLCAARWLGDVVMYDIVEDVPKGKCLDIAEAARIDRFDVAVTGTNDIADIKDADICIVTAGKPRSPGMSRNDLLLTNAKIISSIGESIKQYAPESQVIVITNPLDVMVLLMQKVTGFPVNKVYGQAGILDSSRLATFFAWELGISVKDINALVLGGHGDCMAPILRFVNVSGIPVMKILEQKYGDADQAREVAEKIIERTRKAGGEIVDLMKNGSAFYSAAAAAVQMIEAVLGDEKRLVPMSAYLSGQYGVNGYYIGVPAILGKDGVERVIEIELEEDEKIMFNRSVTAVMGLVEDLKAAGY